MLRIPNPISDLTEVVKIYCDIFPILKSYKDFELDVVSKALIQTSNVTSQGAIGIEALERSTRADRSRDPIYNQSKALCELYRLLGWLQSTTAQTKYIVTYLGEALVNAKDKDNVVEECLIGLSYPNECVEVKANTNLRPFKSILYYLNMNNSLSRDEIIYGVLNIDDDTNAQELESLSKKMIAFRKIRNGLKNELIQIGKKINIKYDPTMGNYTRFPISAIKWANFGEKENNTFIVTQAAKNKFRELTGAQDIRLNTFNKLKKEEQKHLIIYSHLKMLQRFGLSIDEIKMRESYRFLIDNNVIENENILFSPFQLLSYETINKIVPDLIYKDAKEYVYINLTEQDNQRAVREELKLKVDIENKKRDFSKISKLSIYIEINNLLSKTRSSEKTISILYKKYENANKDVFYPLVADLLCVIGFNCKVSRGGQNYERADAIIIDDKYSIPIEIKSPGEETEISVKAIRQALENKIIFLSRQQYKTDNETTSLAIGYNLPNMRSEVFELIEDIHNAFNFNICVLSFTDLLVMAVSVINSGKEISIQNFRTLKGVYNVKKLNNN